MSGVNKVILIGNVGRDPEVRYTPNGDAVANIALATSESWKDKNTGQREEKTEWHRLVFFKRQAEIVSEYIKKGSKIFVEGKLQTRSWEQDGIKRFATEIIVNNMQMLDTRERNGNGSTGTANTQQAPGKPAGTDASSQGGFDDFDDDIPFSQEAA